MDRALVVVPTYNERNNVGTLVEKIGALEMSFDVLIVDDNSPDGTGEVADELARGRSNVHVLHRPHKDGLGRAYIAAFGWALERDYPHVLQMDADHSHDPTALPELVRAAERFDLVLGSRYVGGIRVLDWELSRLLISVAGNWYARLVTGLPFTDLTGGFKCYHRHVLAAIDLPKVASVGYAFQIEMTWRALQCGFRIGEVPITFYGRGDGGTKFTKAIVWEAVWNVWKLRLGFIR